MEQPLGCPTGIFLEQGIFFRARNKKFFNENTQINFVGIARY